MSTNVYADNDDVVQNQHRQYVVRERNFLKRHKWIFVVIILIMIVLLYVYLQRGECRHDTDDIIELSTFSVSGDDGDILERYLKSLGVGEQWSVASDSLGDSSQYDFRPLFRVLQ